MGEWGEEKGFSPSALSLFRFHLSPFPPETPDTQAIIGRTLTTRNFPPSGSCECALGTNLKSARELGNE